MFSRRTQWPKGPNPLAELLEQKKTSSRKILDLTVSNPTLCGFDYLNDPFFSGLDHPRNIIYTPDPRGLFQARQAVAGYYSDKGVEISPERIFLTSGTSEAYSYIFRLLADAGQTVLAPSPGYPLFDCLCQLHDLVLEKYPLCYTNGHWNLDEASLAGFSKTSPKALMWIHPNNPTGNYAATDQMRALRRFSAVNQCPIIADEVFLDFQFAAQAEPKTFAASSETLTFTLSGISKILGLPQMKLSWIVVSGPEELAAEACRRLEIIADTYLSVSGPVQRMLPGWLGRRHEVIGQILDRVRANRSLLEQWTKKNPRFELMNSDGGWYGALRGQDINDEEFCVNLLKEKDVLVHPGYLFDFTGDDYLVMSLLVEPSAFVNGLAAIAA